MLITAGTCAPPNTWRSRGTTAARLSPAQYGDDRHRLVLTAVQAAAVLGDAEAGASYLARTGFSAQLQGQLEQLGDAGRTRRVALRFQSSRGIDRNAAAQ